jgi:iron complex outermembrane receptor protein
MYKYILSFAIAVAPMHGAVSQSFDEEELLGLSLESLMDIEVTSVSKTSEKASEAPAALHVITNETIRRSGATSVPEVLRLVPGLQVAQSGAGEWGVSARGFNDQFANKLLVLVDGRTIYTPLFQGVYWDIQNLILEDIERIEVIRGPGATLWGANAVNGVINIITKSAKDTLGSYVQAGAGNRERGFLDVRHGVQLAENSYARMYFKTFNRDEQRDLTNNGARDDWRLSQGGFRADMELSPNDTLTLQGDLYGGERNNPIALPTFLNTTGFDTVEDNALIEGANILARWNRTISEDSDITVQAYFDYTGREEVFLDQAIYTTDIDFQHNYQLNERNFLTWGVGFRHVADDIDGTDFISYSPVTRNDALYSAFIQNKYTVIPDELFLTVGTKYEFSRYDNSQWQPSARIAYIPNERETIWAAVSRAVKTNARSTDISLITQSFQGHPTLGSGFVRLLGADNVKSEELLSYELGYRSQPLDNLAYDVTLFYNIYDHLSSLPQGTPFVDTSTSFPPHVVIPVILDDENSGKTYGGELSVNWFATDYWELAFGYSYLVMDLDQDFSTFVNNEGKSPEHSFNIRSNIDLTDDIELDNYLYYVDELDSINVDKYIRFDTRIAWKPYEGVELSLVGQNLFDDNHQEFSPFVSNFASQVGRSVYGAVTLRF